MTLLEERDFNLSCFHDSDEDTGEMLKIGGGRECSMETSFMPTISNFADVNTVKVSEERKRHTYINKT